MIKMKKIIFIGIMLLLASSILVSAAETNEICDYIMDDIKMKEGMFVPKFIPYSTDSFNIYSGNNSVGNIIIDEKKVKSLGCDSINDSTYNVYIKNVDTLKDIFTAEKQVDVLNEKLSNKDIVVTTDGFFKNMNLAVTIFGIRVVSWFS